MQQGVERCVRMQEDAVGWRRAREDAKEQGKMLQKTRGYRRVWKDAEGRFRMRESAGGAGGCRGVQEDAGG